MTKSKSRNSFLICLIYSNKFTLHCHLMWFVSISFLFNNRYLYQSYLLNAVLYKCFQSYILIEYLVKFGTIFDFESKIPINSIRIYFILWAWRHEFHFENIVYMSLIRESLQILMMVSTSTQKHNIHHDFWLLAFRQSCFFLIFLCHVVSYCLIFTFLGRQKFVWVTNTRQLRLS